jgi:hypothetical protein
MNTDSSPHHVNYIPLRNVKIIPIFTHDHHSARNDDLDSRWLNNDLHVFLLSTMILFIEFNNREEVDVCLKIGRKWYKILSSRKTNDMRNVVCDFD